jgi:hypothetical protein
MEKETFEDLMTRLDFSWEGSGDYRIELIGDCATLKVDLSLGYKFIEGNEIIIDNNYTLNLNDIDNFNKLLQEDIARFKKAYASLKEALEKGGK